MLRPGGRHLVVHDYGRDDVSRLHGERPEYGAWSQRTGPFLTGGFRVRVRALLLGVRVARGDRPRSWPPRSARPGRASRRTLKRPRLSYNVAIYHRSRP